MIFCLPAAQFVQLAEDRPGTLENVPTMYKYQQLEQYQTCWAFYTRRI